jgi:hypothetical protein
MKPSNLGFCFNGAMDIVLSAQYANLNSRWLNRVLYPAFDGFHNNVHGPAVLLLIAFQRVSLASYRVLRALLWEQVSMC